MRVFNFVIWALLLWFHVNWLRAVDGFFPKALASAFLNSRGQPLPQPHCFSNARNEPDLRMLERRLRRVRRDTNQSAFANERTNKALIKNSQVKKCMMLVLKKATPPFDLTNTSRTFRRNRAPAMPSRHGCPVDGPKRKRDALRNSPNDVPRGTRGLGCALNSRIAKLR